VESASWLDKLNSDPAISFLLFRAHPILLNGLFIAYLIWGQSRLMEQLNASQDGAGDWQLGGLLLIVPLVEIIGIRLKHPVSAYFAWRYPRQGTSDYLVAVFILTAVFRLALGFFYLIVAFQVGGGKPVGQLSGGWQLLMVVMVFVIIIIETLAILLAFPLNHVKVNGQPPPSSNLPLERWLQKVLYGRTPEQIDLKIALLGLLGDLLMLVFSAVVYTAVWDFYTQGNETGMEAVDFLGLTIFFLWVFLPLRMTSLVDEMTTQTGKWQREISVVSLAAVWLAEMLRLH
jgi:hypothetical protein